MKEKKTKGQFGYREYHRKIQVYQVLFGFAMILLQLAARNFTDSQSVRNILTVMAVLSVLPTANAASPLLASWNYKTPSIDFYNRVSPYEAKFIIMYDLILTSKEAVMPMDAVIVHPTGVYAYCIASKTDEKKGEASVNAIFTAHKLDPNVKILKEEKAFFHRMESLKPAAEYEDDGSLTYAVALLKNLSM